MMEVPAPGRQGTERSNPFVGPDPLAVGARIFGREREIRELLDLLIGNRIVLLHSPAGAGKTSLVQAGIVPALRDDKYRPYVVHRSLFLGNSVPPPADGTPVRNRFVYATLVALEREPSGLNLSPAELADLELSAYLD